MTAIGEHATTYTTRIAICDLYARVRAQIRRGVATTRSAAASSNGRLSGGNLMHTDLTFLATDWRTALHAQSPGLVYVNGAFRHRYELVPPSPPPPPNPPPRTLAYGPSPPHPPPPPVNPPPYYADAEACIPLPSLSYFGLDASTEVVADAPSEERASCPLSNALPIRAAALPAALPRLHAHTTIDQRIDNRLRRPTASPSRRRPPTRSGSSGGGSTTWSSTTSRAGPTARSGPSTRQGRWRAPKR